MDELKLIFAGNLIKLRTDSGMTQAQLAEKLNYSDKTVSKWERGEAVPDAYVLKQLGVLFSVTVDDLLRDNTQWKNTNDDPMQEKVEYSRLFVILAVIVGIFTLCMIEFCIVWMLVGAFHWLIFVAAVPLSLIVILVFNSIWFKGRYNTYIIAALVLSLVVIIYLSLLKFNFWQLFLILIPAELLVFISCNIPRKIKLPIIAQDKEKEEN